MHPPHPPLHPKHPPTETPTGDPTPPDSPADHDLDNTEPCEAFTLMTPPLSTSWTPIPLLTLSINPTFIMCTSTHLPIMGPLLIGKPIVALLAQM